MDTLAISDWSDKKMAEFLHFPFKIQYFSRLKFPNHSLHFQTIFNINALFQHYFQLYDWYIVQSSVNSFIFSGFFIDFLKITHRVPKIKNNTYIKYTEFYMHIRKSFVPSINYSWECLHANALQFLYNFI